ncbi:hypothetical protein Tsubulata_006252 [Turnera subulata]|uniref:Transmembrane protein n=1 Tax=Turnera subulata TaxID=218843 RepID=A0A9Q0FKG3_9ROSI|nr:hypothetical protein Tsubulata_006252 [Turnera subulata]
MPDHQSCLAATATALTNSVRIIITNRRVFFSIFALLALPLSFLAFSLSLSSFSVKAHVLHLESLAALSSTRFEARHVWKESRESAISLLHLKLLYFPPSYLLSLLASVASVSAAHSASSGHPASLESSLSAFKSSWYRPLLTSICIHALLFLYSCVPYTLGAAAGAGPGGSGAARLAIWAVGWGVEVYLMAVMGMGLVVSIMERSFGFGAIRVGSELMEGRRVCGWALSGLLAFLTGWIGWRMEALLRGAMDGGDVETPPKWSVEMGLARWDWVGLVCLYGLVVVWGYVVSTVFYFECRKRHVVREDDCEDDSS